MIKKCFLALFLVGLMATLAGAGANFPANFPMEALQQDLGEKSARLISGPQDQLLVNKGENAGIQKGDLFTVYAPGSPVIDPQTGKRLGELAEPLAVCQAEEVHPRFAEVRIYCLQPECKVASGLEAVRFRDVKVTYLDAAADTFSHYKSLRAALRHLDWQGYAAVSGKEAEKRLQKANKGTDQRVPELTLTAGRDRLTLWAGSEILAVYPAGDSAESKAHRAEQPTASGKSAAGAPPPGMAASEAQSLKAATVPGTTTEIKARNIRVMASQERVVHNFGVTVPAGQKQPYLVTLSGVEIQARALNADDGHQYAYDGFGEVVNMSVAPDGRLALNIFVPGEGMRSKLLLLSEEGFRPLAADISYILAFMPDPAGSGQAQLWGQRFSQADLFIPSVYRLKVENNGLTRAGSIPVPHAFSLFGAFHADVNANGTPECGFFNPGGRLAVYEAAEKKWQSSASFAGSLKTLLIDDPENDDMAPREIQVWSQPAFFRYQQKAYVACALNQGGIASMLGQSPRQGTVGLLDSPGRGFRLRPLENRFSGPIQDVFFWRDQLLVCVVEGGVFNKSGPSHILSLPAASLFSSAR